VEAGADAVYAGFSSFSARAYADNFSLAELSGVIEESRRCGVDVHIAFNSLIKEGELAQAFKTLMALAALKPAAFIIQDLGLAHLARSHCPQIPIHASTLTAAYTRGGLYALKSLGFSRAVLPRELGFKEIETLVSSDIMPLEMFVHGAMCFSFSGLCLFSSFLGGRSALRGGCTQPCRRSYLNAGKKRTFFSAADLEASEFIPAILSLPIGALKIEGRMKGPDYVRNTVRAYRLLIDGGPEGWEDSISEAGELLDEVAGRPAGIGFLKGFSAPLVPQGASGQEVGSFYPTGPDQGQVKLMRPIRLLDRLRLVPAPGQEGLSFKVRKMLVSDKEVAEARAGETVGLFVGRRSEAGDKKPGTARDLNVLPKGLLYLTSSGRTEKEYLSRPMVRKVKILADGYKAPSVALPRELKARTQGQAHGFAYLKHLWFWVQDLDSFPEILKSSPEKLILPLTADNVRTFGRLKRAFRSGPDIVWSLPPLLFSRSWEKTRRDLGSLTEQGFREFMVAGLGQAAFLARTEKKLKIWGDYRLGPMNRFAGHSLAELGFCGVTLSPELDQETYSGLVKSPWPGQILIYLFGRPALFTSRFQPQGLKHGPIVSERGEKFWAGTEGDAFTLYSESRIFMNACLKSPVPGPLAGLIADLRQEQRPGETARAVRKAVAEGRGSLGSGFNFKRGLR
jgi:putative protease